MARDVLQIDAEIDALRAARATGALRVSIGGRTIEYRSLAEIERVLQSLVTERGTVNGDTKRVRRVNVVPERGL